MRIFAKTDHQRDVVESAERVAAAEQRLQVGRRREARQSGESEPGQIQVRDRRACDTSLVRMQQNDQRVLRQYGHWQTDMKFHNITFIV